MKHYFLEHDAVGLVLMQHCVDWAGEGPPAPPEAMAGNALLAVAERVDLGAMSATTELHITASGILQVETATLDDLKAAKNAQINAAKLDANNSYFPFGGKQIAYTAADRVEIQGINNVVMLTGAMPADPDWPKAWKAMDNSWVPIPDKETWTAFNVAIASRGTAHFKRAQELKGALARATTPAEIEAITW